MASALFGRATWSNSPTVNDVTLPAEFMLKFAVNECERYASWRTSPYKWLLVRSVDRHVHSLIPCFHRVYTVTSHEVDNSVCLMCDCNYFECNGMVCPHMVHVKRYYASNPNISHHDVSVRWWKSYIYFAMKKESDCSATEKDIKQKLQSLCRNDCKWPNFIPKNDDHSFSPFHRVYKCGTSSNEQFTNATERTIGSLFRKASVLNRVINYTREEVEIALRNTKTNLYQCRKRFTCLMNKLSTSTLDTIQTLFMPSMATVQLLRLMMKQMTLMTYLLNPRQPRVIASILEVVLYPTKTFSIVINTVPTT